MRRMLALIASVVLILGFIGCKKPAETVSGLKAKVDSLQTEITNFQSVKDSLTAELDSLKADYDSLMTEYEKVTAKKPAKPAPEVRKGRLKPPTRK